MKKRDLLEIPSSEALEAELKRVQHRKGRQSTVKRTVYILITVAAIAVLLVTLFFPVMRIYGTSMAPTLESGDVVAAIKNATVEQGDVVAFYYNNKVLVKRVIGCAGDWIDLDASGTVLVNGQKLDEPYLTSPSLGDTDIELPYQVPEGRYFVMGDHRESSVDSRNTVVGTVSEEQILGRVVVCLWPFDRLGLIS